MLNLCTFTALLNRRVVQITWTVLQHSTKATLRQVWDFLPSLTGAQRHSISEWLWPTCSEASMSGTVTFPATVCDNFRGSWGLTQGCARCSYETSLNHISHTAIRKKPSPAPVLCLQAPLHQTMMVIEALDTACMSTEWVKCLRLDILPRATAEWEPEPRQTGMVLELLLN